MVSKGYKVKEIGSSGQRLQSFIYVECIYSGDVKNSIVITIDDIAL